MNHKQRGTIPPQEVRFFCYEVAQSLAQGSPRLDELFPRLRDASFEATHGELLSYLTNTPVWRSSLPGLKQTPLPGGDREVEIELMDVMAAMLTNGYTIANTWNSLLILIESKAVRLDILMERLRLIPRAEAMACKINFIEYPSGRVVLRTDFNRFQEYLSQRGAESPPEPSSEERKSRRTGERAIPRELRTRPMTLAEAAHLMGYKGKPKAIARELSSCFAGLETDRERAGG
jgi:hypothetical protein